MGAETTVGAPIIGWADVGSMIFMLLIVLSLIFLLAWFARRFNLSTALPARKGMRVIASQSLGTKEKLVIVQVGSEHLLLGVTAQNIRMLKTLPQDFEQELQLHVKKEEAQKDPSKPLV